MRNKKLRILVVVDKVIPVTGPHRYVHGMIQALAFSNDVELHVLCGEFELAPEVLKQIKLTYGFKPHSTTKIVSNLLMVRRAIRDCDLIYVPTGLKSFLYSWALKGGVPLAAGPNVTGIPFLMNIFNPSPLMTVKMADIWIEMSEFRIKQCIEAGTPREKIYLVPHSVDINLFSPIYKNKGIWKNYGISSSNTIIIYSGRIDNHRKGINEIIEAFKKIKDVYENVTLVLIGRIQTDLKEFPSTSGVYFLGPKSGQEFATLIASADLFMAASRYETFWLCPLEAMSCGLPVIVSEVGAVRSMIPENGVQGVRLQIVEENDRYSCPPNSSAPYAFGCNLPEQKYKYHSDAVGLLAQAAIAMLADKEKMAAMGHAAREFVLDEFNESKLSERLINVFRVATKVKHK